jgi:hypothetical protein
MAIFDQRPIQERFAEAAKKKKSAPPPVTKEFAPPVRRETSPAGTLLDKRTIEARDAEVARRAAARVAKTAPAPQVQVSPLGDKEGFVIGREWASAKEGWHGSEYNGKVLHDIMQAYNLPITFAGLDAAFDFGVAHNHFEPARRHRGQPAPVPFVSPKQTQRGS